MRAAIYTRISDDRNGDGAGVERQETECRALAARLGWEVVNVCSDNSISAFKGKHRPGFEDLEQLVRFGKVDAVVAWAADRLTRHPRELEDLVTSSTHRRSGYKPLCPVSTT
jgi:DNA invertase Pin-like site-specific DNA recombinase